MLDATWDLVRTLLGLDAQDLNAGQMALRAVLTFVVTVAVVRLGDKRLFGKGTAFDLVVSIMIGSVMSRAITNSSGLLATWLAGSMLVGLHWLVAYLAYRDWFGPLVKGNPVMLIKDGEVQQDAMRDSHLTEKDVEGAIRAQGSEPDPSQVRLSYLERDGSISVIPRKDGPRLLEVSVEDGVQTVRIAVE